MADYFVRRCRSAINGDTYPEMWFDSPNPTTSIEHKSSIKESYLIGDEHKHEYEVYLDAFQTEANTTSIGFIRGQQMFPLTMFEWLDKIKYPKKD